MQQGPGLNSHHSPLPMSRVARVHSRLSIISRGVLSGAIAWQYRAASPSGPVGWTRDGRSSGGTL